MITSQADQLSRGLVDRRCPRETQTCRSSHPGQQPHQAPCHPLIITSDHNFLRRSGNMFWVEKFSCVMPLRAVLLGVSWFSLIMRPSSVCPLQVFSLIFGRLIPFLLLRPVIVPIKRLCPPQLLPLLEAAFVLFPPLLCFALSNVPMFPDLLFQCSNTFTSSLSSQVGGVGSSKSGNLISWGRRVGAGGHPTVQNDDFRLLAGQDKLNL